MKEHYDVGILGVWFGCNYGSIATYYCLQQTIEELGYSTLMIHRPRLKPDDGRMKGRHSIRFAEEHYDISPSYHVSEIEILNKYCDTFVLGSDQIWNYGVTKIFGHSYFLDFAADDKKKIAYATSFGGSEFSAPKEFYDKAVSCMKRMDAISVREASGVDICKSVFGVKAKHVLDPVLMAEPHVLGDLADKHPVPEKEPYIATYILDPTPEKREALLYVSEKLNKKMCHLLDGWFRDFKENKEKLNLPGIVEKPEEEEWLAYIKNSDFVITDSFHGTCMAILFNKPFITIGNPSRGSARFESLLGAFNLWDRYARVPEEILKNPDFLKPVDYERVNALVEAQRKESREWLKNALEGKGEGIQLGFEEKIQSLPMGIKMKFIGWLKRVVKKIL